MELFSVEPSSCSAVFPHAREETPTWLSVDLRFVIAAVVVFGAVAAIIIRFSHEVFDPLADACREGVSPFRLQTLVLPGTTLKEIYRTSAGSE